jgi:hypothetical protein
MLIINELYFAKQHSQLASTAGEDIVQKKSPTITDEGSN